MSARRRMSCRRYRVCCAKAVFASKGKSTAGQQFSAPNRKREREGEGDESMCVSCKVVMPDMEVVTHGARDSKSESPVVAWVP